MSDKILIKGGSVLTLGPRTPNHAVADVLVEDGIITEVGSGLRARDATQIDAGHAVVMPGFVDTHRHVWKSLFRNIGETGSSSGSVVSPEVYGPSYGPDDVYAATLIGLLGAIEAGITTVVDWADISSDPVYVDAALQAHSDAGMRTVFVHAVPAWEKGHEDEKANLRRLAARQANTADTKTWVAFGPGDPAHSQLDRLSRDFALARELGMRVHTHVGVDPAEQGVVAEMGSRGILGEDVTVVHCSYLDDADLDAIASHKTTVSLAPSSEMAYGMALPPIQRLIDRGIRPGLGVDSEGMAPGDIFSQMRATNSVQHATHFDLKLAGKGGLSSLLTTREVIRYATIDGARVAGLAAITGSLEVGKQADIVVMRTDRPNIWPINDPIGAVVWGMDTSNVDWVIAGGRVLMREGQLTADVASARELATTAQRRVAGAAGLLVTAGGKT